MAYCQYCGREIPEDARYCPHCGATQNIYQNHTTFQTNPMKWYTFLVYVGLIVGAISYVFTGVQMLTGGHYDGNANYVYTVFPWLKIVDVIVGLGSIAIAILAIVTRQKLVNYRSDGPKFLTIYYSSAAILAVIYIVIISIPGGQIAANIMTMIPSLAVSVLMIYVNKSYFDKRKDMFIN